MNVKNHTIGILGSGWVAEKMAITLAGMKGYECLAIASRRSEERRVGKECRSRWSPYH